MNIFEKYPVASGIVAFAIILFVVIQIFGTDESKKLYRSGGVIVPGAPCKCYCSDKCGPRDMKPGIDRPYVDSETGLCFCLPRDKANYIPNRCTPKAFANSCCA